jgi:hypothetical protein
MGTVRVHDVPMARNTYEIADRYELTCPACRGAGCPNCRRNGSVPVYTLVIGHGSWRCSLLGHDMVGDPFRAEDVHQLPRVAWCLHCTWQQVHTDVPEAYDLEAEHTA